MRITLLVILQTAVTILVPTATAGPASRDNAWPGGWISRVPARFEQNAGQAVERTRFLARGFGFGVQILDDKVMFLLSGESGERWGLGLSFAGATGAGRVSGEGMLDFPGYHFRGVNEEMKRVSAPQYRAVRYQELYPGIDLLLHGQDGSLEIDLILTAGADLRAVGFGFEGVTAYRYDAQGALILETPVGELPRNLPKVYRTTPGGRKRLECRYVARGEDLFGIETGPPASGGPLVARAAIGYSTFIGGGGAETVNGMTVDAAGNIYLTGQTTSVNFPVVAGVQTSANGNGDAFVVKLNPAGSSVIYATYLGGEMWDAGEGLAVNGQGEVYVTGASSSAGFPVTAGAFQQCCGVFVAKLGANGDSLVYSTFAGDGEPAAIVVDDIGAAIITGSSRSAFPTTPGAYQEVCCQGYDGFVAKIRADGGGLVFSTLIGGSGSDYPADLFLGPSGDIFLAGRTHSTDFPTTAGAAQVGTGGGWDMFVTKMNGNGTGLAFSTYAGGSLSDYASSITVDAAGRAYVAGDSESADFPTTDGAFGPSPVGGAPRGTVFKLDAAGSFFQSATFLPGRVASSQLFVALEPDGMVVVAGSTNNPDFPATGDAPQPTLGGYYDVFASRFDGNLESLLFSSFFGGQARESVAGVAIGPGGSVYVAGHTGSADFPTTQGSYQTGYGGAGDAFVVRFDGTSTSCIYTLGSFLAEFGSAGGAGSFAVSAGSGCVWSAASSAPWISIASSANSGAGNGVVEIQVAANSAGPRAGVVYVAGQGFVVTQSGNQTTCDFLINPTQQTVSSSGGSFSASVIASRPDCEWTATEDLSWVSVTGLSPGSGSGAVEYSVSLNSAGPRAGSLSIAGQQLGITQDGGNPSADRIAVFMDGWWAIDSNGSFNWEDGVDNNGSLGWRGGVPLVGDWNGDGHKEIGFFDGTAAWFLDYNASNYWEEAPTDRLIFFGFAGGQPVIGDWNGDGRTKVGFFDGTGAWFLDYNGNGIWDGPPADKLMFFGWAGVTPKTGDWNGDGRTKIGFFDGTGAWFLDYNGNAVWDGTPADKIYFFGWADTKPLVGDWNGDGRDKIGLYDGTGAWLLDDNGNGIWDNPPNDKLIFFGWAGTTAVVGDWNGDGRDKIGVFDGTGAWLLDYDGSGAWEGSPTDKTVFFGFPGITPVTGL